MGNTVRRFVNARSPLRLLEQGLHGGLGRGNLGLVLAAPGVGKSSFLVGVALDELLRGKPVLHVACDHGVQHVRDHYDTVFEELVASTHLENPAVVRAEIDRLRRIRVYPPSAIDAKRLHEALDLERELGARPELIVVDGLDVESRSREELQQWAALAREAQAEVWITAHAPAERIDGVPAALRPLEDLFAVILALEPAGDTVALRALKEHDNPNVAALHVALDPRTLLLVRS
ncbi:MAG TPA: AAA family ATPase [Myxococcota bacterium]